MSRAWSAMESSTLLSEATVCRLFHNLMAPFGDDHPFSCIPGGLTERIGRPPKTWDFITTCVQQVFRNWASEGRAVKRRKGSEGDLSTTIVLPPVIVTSPSEMLPVKRDRSTYGQLPGGAVLSTTIKRDRSAYACENELSSSVLQAGVAAAAAMLKLEPGLEVKREMPTPGTLLVMSPPSVPSATAQASPISPAPALAAPPSPLPPPPEPSPALAAGAASSSTPAAGTAAAAGTPAASAQMLTVPKLELGAGCDGCMSSEDCCGFPGDRLVQHVLNGQLADVYCENCWETFLDNYPCLQGVLKGTSQPYVRPV